MSNNTRTPWRSRLKLLVGGTLSASLAVATIVGLPLVAQAAGAPIASGTITVDSNGDGQIGTATAPGLADTPASGVALELVCQADGLVRATTTSGQDGYYEFGDGDLGNCAGPVFVRMSINGFAGDQYATELAPTAGGLVRTSNAMPATLAVSAPFAPNTAAPSPSMA